MSIRLIHLVILFLTLACNTNDCTKLPETFANSKEAIILVKKSTFKKKERVETPQSSWIIGASYYSCDGDFGYFILETAKREFLYAKVPKGIWEGFKVAGSAGRYYNTYIKGRYSIRYRAE